MEPTTKYYELTVSEFEWKISANKSVTAWGFNNVLPGPVLRAKKGDTLVVRVINNLSEATAIHWHGIRLISSMDGTGDVQKPIAPGQEFTYRFTLPDAGTFWYHSHHNETVQMEKGMYGALIIEDFSDPVVDDERVLVIDDMKLTADHKFKQGGALAKWIERHDGRQGDTLLINGREHFRICMNAGQLERWRIINAASARYMRLYLGGKTFRIIATDGNLLETPKTVTEVLMTPGERIDVLAGPFEEGEIFFFESLAYNRRTFAKTKHEKFATVHVDEPKPSHAYIPERLTTIQPLAPKDAPVTRRIKFSVGASLKNGMDFLVNNSLHHHDLPVFVGDLQAWEISNTSLMDHPFHLHGFFFQVLEVNGSAPDELAWKDTVNLPPRSKVKIAWVPDNRPGKWMYHCHILEHHEAGMMAHFEVIDPNKSVIETSAVPSCMAH
jgi:FtsP/CotA-like multicopper oxidase with cupredoxin domain